MAEKKEKRVEERILTVNLRGVVTKKPDWRRSKDSIRILKDVLKRQAKARNVKMGKSLNEKIWSRGVRKPPKNVRIKIINIDNDTVRAELME